MNTQKIRSIDSNHGFDTDRYFCAGVAYVPRYVPIGGHHHNNGPYAQTRSMRFLHVLKKVHITDSKPYLENLIFIFWPMHEGARPHM